MASYNARFVGNSTFSLIATHYVHVFNMSPRKRRPIRLNGFLWQYCWWEFLSGFSYFQKSLSWEGEIIAFWNLTTNSPWLLKEDSLKQSNPKAESGELQMANIKNELSGEENESLIRNTTNIPQIYEEKTIIRFNGKKYSYVRFLECFGVNVIFLRAVSIIAFVYLNRWLSGNL